MSDQYYIRFRGRVQGPFDAEKLRQLARRGQFSRMHEVSSDGQQWSPASQQPELFAPAAVPVAANAAAASPAAVDSWRGSGPSSAAAAGSTQEGWYFVSAGKEQGPVEFSALQEHFVSRRLSPETEVWRTGMVEWVAANTVPGLVPTPAASTTQPLVAVNTASQPALRTELEPFLLRSLAASRPWVIFISVIGFIYAALLFVSGLMLVIVSSRLGAPPGTVAGITNMVFGIVVFTGAWMLMNHAGGINMVERTRQEETLRSCLDALKNFWVYAGIVLIVLLTLVTLAVIVAVASPSALPDFHLN